jgi:hypothetical protein
VADAGILQPFRPGCDALVEGGRDLLRGEWDARLGAVLSPFAASRSAAVQALLTPSFATRVTAEALSGASPTARAIAEKFGGLDAGQELFVSESAGGVALFGCWWPWGSGDRISIRIGLWLHAVPESDRPPLVQELRGWFGV